MCQLSLMNLTTDLTTDALLRVVEMVLSIDGEIRGNIPLLHYQKKISTLLTFLI